MKALFWKEIRENLMWALLAAVCVAGALFYGLRSDPDRMSYGNNLWMGMLSPQELLVSTFGFPVIAAAFGFLQILTELRRDQWAFLVHRPVTRAQVYWGKAIPGILLYLLATIPPYLLVAWWASLPGSLAAPFDWRTTQAAFIDVLTGSAFYFAALWTGISQGKWYGKRLLPLVAACYGAVLTKGYLPISYALPYAIITLLAILPASLAAFLTFGIFRKERWWGKAATGLSLLLATCMLWIWLSAGWTMIFPRKPYTGTDYRILKDGQIVKVWQQGSWMKKVETPDGTELKPPNGKTAWNWDDFLNTNYVSLSTRKERARFPYRQPGQYYQQIYGNTMNVQWYYVSDLQCFVSYDLRTKMLSGYLGPNGYADSADKAGRFPVNMNGFRYQGYDSPFIAGNALYNPRLSSNEVIKLYDTPGGETLLGGAMYQDRNVDQDAYKDFVVATNRTIEARSGEGTVIWTMPQLENADKYQSLEISRMEDKSKYFLIFQPDYRFETEVGELLYTLAPGGQVLTKTEVPPKRKQLPKVTWKTVQNRAPYPLGQVLWEYVNGIAMNYMAGEKITFVWNYEPASRTYTLTLWGLALGLGVVCAALSLLLLPRLELTKGQRIVWVVFILFYSFAGLFVFLVANAWPRRVRCAACAKKRSIERTTCEHCGAPWAEPKRDGTEIFESVEVVKA